MKRRDFVVLLLGTALLASRSADAADPMIVYKDAS